MNQLRIFVLVVVCAVIAPSALAGAVSNAPLLDLAKRRISDIKQGRIEGFHLAWGTPDAAIEKRIGDATNAQSNINLLGAVQNAKASPAKNPSEGHGQACVVTLLATNSGTYISTRECTTKIPDKNYMERVFYPQAGIYITGRMPGMDFVRDNPGYGFVTFYTPQGYVDEFLIIVNGIQ